MSTRAAPSPSVHGTASRPPNAAVQTPLVYWPPIVGTGLVTLVAAIAAVWALNAGATPAAIAPGGVHVEAGAWSFVEPPPVIVLAPPEEAPATEAPPPVFAKDGPSEELAEARVKPPAEPREVVVVPPPPLLVEAPPAVKAIPPMDKKLHPVHDEHFGAAFAFCRNMFVAREEAKKDGKLLFLLHVSGDFEDPGFT